MLNEKCKIFGNVREFEPSHIQIVIGEIGDLPLFNPDREDENIPTLSRLKTALKEASGLIIASPEYAHGISGPLKNALDWFVGGDEFPYIPIMLINTSTRSSLALETLKEVLITMSGNIIHESYVSVPLLGSDLTYTGIIKNSELAKSLTFDLKIFCDEIEIQKT
ncbi:MAG: chromate reductase [Gammaproteobacteria bacterium]